jgi:hypothetical protein
MSGGDSGGKTAFSEKYLIFPNMEKFRKNAFWRHYRHPL